MSVGVGEEGEEKGVDTGVAGVVVGAGETTGLETAGISVGKSS